MAYINMKDTDGTKGTLLKGQLGYDDYTAGGDTGRVYVGDGTTNIALAKKSEVDTNTTAIATKLNATNPSITGSITEEVSAVIGNALEPDNGTIQTLALSADVTLTDGLSDGQYLVLRISGGDTYVVTYPTTTWVAGSAPTLTANDVLVFWKEGTTLYGMYSGTVVQA